MQSHRPVPVNLFAERLTQPLFPQSIPPRGGKSPTPVNSARWNEALRLSGAPRQSQLSHPASNAPVFLERARQCRRSFPRALCRGRSTFAGQYPVHRDRGAVCGRALQPQWSQLSRPAHHLDLAAGNNLAALDALTLIVERFPPPETIELTEKTQLIRSRDVQRRQGDHAERASQDLGTRTIGSKV